MKFKLVSALGPAAFVLLGCTSQAESSAKEKIESRLLDPMSVQYRGIKMFSEDVVCGEFNAKNRMGGYNGFKKFIYQAGELKSLDALEETRLCSDDPRKSEPIVEPPKPVKMETYSAHECNMATAEAEGKTSSTPGAMSVEELRMRTACMNKPIP